MGKAGYIAANFFGLLFGLVGFGFSIAAFTEIGDESSWFSLFATGWFFLIICTILFYAARRAKPKKQPTWKEYD
jgi:hypothetical protein